MQSSDFRVQVITPEQTYALRHQVLWPNRPVDYVKLDEDFEGLHYGVITSDQVIGVISIFQDGLHYRFRKFAIHPDYQGKGLGSLLLTRVIEDLRIRGVCWLWCDARVTAIAFYERFGMQPEGSVFFKGEIAYTRLVLDLTRVGI